MTCCNCCFPVFTTTTRCITARWRNSPASGCPKSALRLEDQVRKSVRIGDPKKPTGRTPPILRQFFHSLAEVRELLRTDIEAAYEGDPAALYSEEIILSYPFIEAIAIQRLAHVLYRGGRADHSAHDDGMGAQPHGH